jgi:hypothetical protein
VKPTAFALLVAAVLLASARPLAHEIPSDVRIQAFLQPEGQHLRLLVRAPVASTVNDVEWPMKGPLLDLAQVRPAVLEAGGRWIASRVDLFEADRQLGSPQVAAVRISLPSDTSFDSYERALAHVTGTPLGADVELVASQALVDVLLEYPVTSPDSRFSIATRFEAAGLRSVTVLRFRTAGTSEGRALQNSEDVPDRSSSARSSFTGIRASSGSTRAGSRPPRDSSWTGSSTSSAASIICCSCCAW